MAVEHVLYRIPFLSRTEKGLFTALFNNSFPHGWHFDGITYKLKALYRYLEINSLCKRSSLHGMNHSSQYCKSSECNTCTGCNYVTPEIIRKQRIFQTHLSEHMLQGPQHKQTVKLINSDKNTRVMKDTGKLDNLNIANTRYSEISVQVTRLSDLHIHVLAHRKSPHTHSLSNVKAFNSCQTALCY